MLPKISSTVHTHKTLDGKVIHFRPFKVSDEQTLLEAKESGDGELIINTVLDILQNIIINKVNIRSLPSFEVEQLLLKARIVSIGNELNVGSECSECDTPNAVKIDLNEVKLNGSFNKENDVSIGKDDDGREVSVIMKYPTFENLEALKKKEKSNILRICIESIKVDDNYIDLTEVNDAELDQWVLDLEKDNANKIYEFIQNMPKMHLDFNFTCKKCKHENEYKFENFESFFT